ncbi:hypothetical protein [truncated ORF], partial [Penicillium rubens Wisconsin 54-1255]
RDRFKCVSRGSALERQRQQPGMRVKSNKGEFGGTPLRKGQSLGLSGGQSTSRVKRGGGARNDSISEATARRARQLERGQEPKMTRASTTKVLLMKQRNRILGERRGSSCLCHPPWKPWSPGGTRARAAQAFGAWGGLEGEKGEPWSIRA